MNTIKSILKRMRSRRRPSRRSRPVVRYRQVSHRFHPGRAVMFLAGRVLLATLLGDSTASTIFLMFPRTRARRVFTLWLAMAIAQAAVPYRAMPRLASARSARPHSLCGRGAATTGCHAGKVGREALPGLLGKCLSKALLLVCREIAGKQRRIVWLHRGLNLLDDRPGGVGKECGRTGRYFGADPSDEVIRDSHVRHRCRQCPEPGTNRHAEDRHKKDQSEK